MIRTDHLDRTTGVLVTCMVGDLAAGSLGYATGGAEGGAIVAIAFALALGAVGGLMWALDGLLGAVGAAADRPDRLRVRLAVVGAIAVAGWAVLAVSVLDLGLSLWGLLGVVALVGGLLGVACTSPSDGLRHGALTGGAGGVLTVYPSAYGSLTVQPELVGFVVVFAVVAPLAFGIAGGVGGGLGGLAFEVVRASRASE